MKAINLKTEYLVNPIGIDVKNPRLFWNCSESIKQTAYQIKAYTDDYLVWDSGKVCNDTMNVNYPCSLKSRQRVRWNLTLWDEKDEKSETEEAFFEMGLLEKNDFCAKWISGNYKSHKGKRYPVDCFKKDFYISHNIKKARLYITSCGLYEAKINEERVGNFYLAPGHTDYKKRIQLQVYDVTDMLKQDKNEICVELADGWYRGSCGAWGLINQYGKQTKLYIQLEITDENNKIIKINSDKSWLWSNSGPIRFCDNQDGEIIDATKKLSFTSGIFAKEAKYKVIPTSSNNYVITEKEHFLPKLIITPKGNKVLDFGQNIAGYITFSLNAKSGQMIKLRFGETFDKDLEFTQTNIQCHTKKRITPLQEIIYKCKDGRNDYKTKFAIFGFQYVLIETDIAWELNDFEAIALYSDLPQTINFNCSNELINQLVKNTIWSAKNNHADVPTDCPTRERHGWTGDAQIFAGTASYLFNYAPFAQKYVKDMIDGQHRNGNIRQISPKGGIDFYMNAMDGSPGWSDAIIIIPYQIFLQYNDIRILKDNYQKMRKYAIYKAHTLGKWYPTGMPTGVGLKYASYISNYGQSYGEWTEPIDVRPFDIKDLIFTHPEESTAYIVYIMEKMQVVADLIDKKDDAIYYKKIADKARIGYQKLVETKKFSLDTNRQAKLVRPLYMNLLNEEQKEFAKKRLVKALDNYNWRLGTGFLSTPFILYVLEKMDIEYAYRLLENEEMPGWLFMPKMKANTIWESWEGTEAQGGVASLDHYSKGAVCQWIFSSMCGINMDNVPNRFIIKPCVGGTLKFAEASYESIYGLVYVKWERDNSEVKYTIVIPSNTSAKIILDDEVYEVDAGKHYYTKIK